MYGQKRKELQKNLEPSLKVIKSMASSIVTIIRQQVKYLNYLIEIFNRKIYI